MVNYLNGKGMYFQLYSDEIENYNDPTHYSLSYWICREW